MIKINLLINSFVHLLILNSHTFIFEVMIFIHSSKEILPLTIFKKNNLYITIYICTKIYNALTMKHIILDYIYRSVSTYIYHMYASTINILHTN